MTNSIDKGFSLISNEYEDLDKTSSLITWMRNRVRKTTLSKLKDNDTILEINCGTGLDAVFFAKKGCKVHATDIASGMIAHVKTKIVANNLENKLSCQMLSFKDLDTIKEQNFDHVFSNFGGLNCCSKNELKAVFNSITNILNHKSNITLVIMPKVCIWEFLKIFKANKQAFRRLKKNGTIANIANEKIRTYYHSAGHVKSLLSKDFKNIKIENICFIGPTGNRIHFPKKYPKLFKLLTSFDAVSSKIPGLRGIGDYYILTAERK